MTKLGKLITAFLIVVALIGGLVYLFKKDSSPKESSLPGFNFSDSFMAASSKSGSTGFANEYINSEFGFRFNHPDGFDIKEIDEDAGITVLAEASGGKTFQIYINDFDEPGPITPERIRKDLPEMKIIQSQTFSLNGTDALAFQSDETVEVWFVYGGYLYQVTALKDFTDDLSRILATWKFE